MSEIKRRPLQRLGFDFVDSQFLSEGTDEFTLRRKQVHSKCNFRPLTNEEIQELIALGNQADDWSNIEVTDAFIPNQIQGNKFYGWVRIADMEASYAEYRNIRLATGIYHSTIVSSEIGSFVAIHQVKFMAHFIIGDEVILHNISEMETSSRAKFGNGIIREGEEETARIALELCNENGGRAVLPFEGMQAADAFIWSRFREDTALQNRFKEMTVSKFDQLRGYYSEIGNRCVIKNCLLIKDVKIGEDAYIKGAHKLKNLTIQSSSTAYTQIGEGCELVNGIIGYGCRIFYGVKAVRFILSSFSQLKYGARLINSFLGDNSTISCCEVLNSLLFPAHEQHHNNSFLCAATVMGQSNMAAGATVGSNHNSRAADGEMLAGRGFWPGLCVSLKHNSRFASYTLIVKGDFLAELDIRIPFTLVANDTYEDKLILIPGYWFMYNMYALVRNANKYQSRDKRVLKNQYLETDMLAPDTVNEMFEALSILQIAVARNYFPEETDTSKLLLLGKDLLENRSSELKNKTFYGESVENSKRKVELKKVPEAYAVFKRMIRYYGALAYLQTDYTTHQASAREAYQNIGGQLMRSRDVHTLTTAIKDYDIQSWDEVHAFYHQCSADYKQDKQKHALDALCEILEIEELTAAQVPTLIDEVIATKEWMVNSIYQTRAKDYENPFKQMVYASEEEMNQVVGDLESNDFIRTQKEELAQLKARFNRL